MDDGVSRAGESSPRVGDDTAGNSAALRGFQLVVTPAEETSIVQAWDPNTGEARRPHEGRFVQPTTHDKSHAASAANVGPEHPPQRGRVRLGCARTRWVVRGRRAQRVGAYAAHAGRRGPVA